LSKWPVIGGDYKIGDEKGSIAVATLDNKMFELVEMEKVAIVGTLKTENIGIERVILNIISNPNIRFLIVCGEEIKGHRTGGTLISLHKNGIDKKRRVIDAPGAIPYIENLPPKAIERFREQVEIVNMLGETDIEKVKSKIIEYSKIEKEPFGEPMFVKVEKRGGKKVKKEKDAKSLDAKEAEVAIKLKELENGVEELILELTELVENRDSFKTGFYIGFVASSLLLTFALITMLILRSWSVWT